MFQYQFGVVAGVPLTWQASYPHQTYRAVLSTALPQTTTKPILTLTPLTPLAWKSVYSDYIDRQRAPIEAYPQGRIDPLPRLTAIPLLSWNGVYPERVDRLTMPVATMRSLASGVQAPNAPLANPVAWQGVWPDSAPAGQLPTADQPSWSSPNLIILPPVPVRAWAGHFADQVWTAPGEPVAQMLAWEGPLPFAVTPSFAWESVYPDVVRVAEPLDVGIGPSLAFSEQAEFPVPSLAWKGVYPNHVTRLVMTPDEMQSFVWVSIQLARFSHRRIMFLAARSLYDLLASQNTTIFIPADDQE